MNKYIVMTSCAKMPNNCWGRYRNVATVRLTDEYAQKGLAPKFIGEHARGVDEVVRMYTKLNVGKTEKCAYAIALKDAKDKCEKLNEAFQYIDARV